MLRRAAIPAVTSAILLASLLALAPAAYAEQRFCNEYRDYHIVTFPSGQHQILFSTFTEPYAGGEAQWFSVLQFNAVMFNSDPLEELLAYQDLYYFPSGSTIAHQIWSDETGTNNFGGITLIVSVFRETLC